MNRTIGYVARSNAQQNALRHLKQKFPKCFEIRWSRCQLCDSRYLASFLLPDKGLHRMTWCTYCGAHGAA